MLSIIQVSREIFHERLNEAVDLYIDAMKYNRAITQGRRKAWANHLDEPEWTAVIAIHHPADMAAQEAAADPTIPLLGVAYAYRGQPGQWWYTQVRGGLAAAGWRLEDSQKLLSSYAELAEIHVAPNAQGFQIGEQLLQALAQTRNENHILLSTPEVPLENNRAWRLYHRLQFEDILRNFYFTGDSRPFAVLGTRLPLSDN